MTLDVTNLAKRGIIQQIQLVCRRAIMGHYFSSLPKQNVGSLLWEATFGSFIHCAAATDIVVQSFRTHVTQIWLYNDAAGARPSDAHLATDRLHQLPSCAGKDEPNAGCRRRLT